VSQVGDLAERDHVGLYVINESRGTRVTAFHSPGFLIIASAF
jgi:hypothetical protein